MEPTSAASSTNLRPRNRRRTNEDEVDNGAISTSKNVNYLDGSLSAGPSTRAPSPIPKTRPSQGTRLERDAIERSHTPNRFLGVPGVGSLQTTSAGFGSSFLHNPWASLQGLASTLIGNDSSSGRSSPARSPSRRSRPTDTPHSTRTTSAPPVQWGPASKGDKQVGVGTREDRAIQVYAKKREALLAATSQGSIAGRYKRRDSDERDHVPFESDERDQLVYLHRVEPQDTSAGITIKYNCQANIFRKANRLWPNDSVQIRKIVVLPVDACAVRGRKIPETSVNGTLPHPDSFTETYDDLMPTPTAAASNPPWSNSQEVNLPKPDQQPSAPSIPASPSISIATSNPDDPPWIHDAWVTIENFAAPVEIARLSRKALGYFPRSRRKSMSVSDLGSPPASFDLPRPSFQTATGSPRRPVSIAGTDNRPAASPYFSKGLHGVGGVGTMSSNVRKPGPAQDGLNKMFAAHLPNSAPQASLESLQSSSAYSNGGIENVGGAIEGWVRKIATKAQTSLQQPVPRGNDGVGDLIELSEDAFELGGDGSEEIDETDERRNAITGWSAKQQEQMLHERFPPRGRMFGDSSKRGKTS